MIVVTPDIEASDAASAHTLVTQECQKVPRHLPTLVYSSFLVSALTLVFTIANVLSYSFNSLPNTIVPVVLGFVCILPHHGAVMLLQWLERHQSESIFAFAPASPRTIAYSLVSLTLWITSTTMCAINLRRNMEPSPNCYLVIDDTSPSTNGCEMFYYYPSVAENWSAVASTLTSSLEVILVFAITSVCYIHHRRRCNHWAQSGTTPAPGSSPSELKVLPTSS